MVVSKKKAAVAHAWTTAEKLPNSTLDGLLAIGYRLLFKVAALLHGALDLVLARLQRLPDGLFAG